MPRNREPPTPERSSPLRNDRVRSRSHDRRLRLTGGGGAVYVDHTFGVRTTILFELRFDPVDRSAVAIGALSPIAELSQALDRGLVAFQV